MGVRGALRMCAAAALFTVAGLAGCAARAPTGPVVSPTGIVYVLGTPPSDTRFSQPAALLIRQELPAQALDLLEQGMEADPGNPIHFFLAGSAEAMLGRWSRADQLFREAERLYPAYELDIEPRRESAWAEAFNAGLDALDQGDLDGTEEAWRGAVVVFSLRPEAHQSLASLLASEGRYVEAAEALRDALEGLSGLPATRVLTEEEVAERNAEKVALEDTLGEYLLMGDQFAEAEPLLRRRVERDPGNVQARGDLAAVLMDLGRSDEAREVYAELLADPNVQGAVLFSLGIASFRAGRFDQASEIFAEVVERQPYSRDAWFNYTNALFASEDWEEITRRGDRLLDTDPLSETVAIIRARAHLELGEEEAARQYLEQIITAPLFLEGLQLSAQATETLVQGRVVGNLEEGGRELRVRFHFIEEGVELGSQILDLRAPPEGESTPFQVRWPGRATAYRYEVIPSGR